MRVIAGIGVVISARHLLAVAIDETGAALGEQRFGGVTTSDAMSAALGRVVGALGGREVPVAVAWDDGGDARPTALEGASPAAVAAQLRRWAAVGIVEISTGSDATGVRWAAPVPIGLADAIERAAGQAGLTVIGAEPAGVARARHPDCPVVSTMALVASGRLPPATRTRTTLTPDVRAARACEGPTVWVVERVDDPPDPARARRTSRWAVMASRLRRR